MPIKGLTTTHTPGAGMPRLGKIVKGAERTDEDKQRNRPGRDLTYLRVKFEPEFAYLAGTWQEMYGDEPRELPRVYMLADDTDQVFGTWMEKWAAGGLLRRCDGETQHRVFDPAQGRVVDSNAPCEQADGCGCKQVGRLNILLPQFTAQTGAFGYFMVETHAVIDIARVYNTLQDVRGLYGTIFGVPFVMSRVEEEIVQPEIDKKTKKPTGNRMHVKKWLLRLTIDAEYARSALASRLMPSTRLVDSETGELLESGAPALPALPAAAQPASVIVQKPTIAEWRAFHKDYIDQGWTPDEILAALQVNGYSEWSGTLAQARAVLEGVMDDGQDPLAEVAE